jgi:hypothetical protein
MIRLHRTIVARTLAQRTDHLTADLAHGKPVLVRSPTSLRSCPRWSADPNRPRRYPPSQALDIGSPVPASSDQSLGQYLASVTRGGAPGSDVPTVVSEGIRSPSPHPRVLRPDLVLRQIPGCRWLAAFGWKYIPHPRGTAAERADNSLRQIGHRPMPFRRRGSVLTFARGVCRNGIGWMGVWLCSYCDAAGPSETVAARQLR